MRRLNQHKVMVAIVAIWMIVVVAGLARVVRYKSTSAQAADAPSHWPSDTTVASGSQDALLLVFLHPHCPCSTASLAELSRLLTDCPTGVTTTVLMVRPRDEPHGWEESALWHAARALPGVTVMTDAGGIEAQRFGVSTSGQVLLYAPDQRLVFAGGITASRGHEGDNDGRAVLASLIRGVDSDAVGTAPVFGCSLLDCKTDTPTGGTSCQTQPTP
jgi:hypothetical protein